MGDRYTRYVQVEVGFPRSKLVDRARAELGLDTDQAIGKLVRLWLAVIQTRDRGSLAYRSDVWIEEEVGWRGEPGQFARFVRAHHLDEQGVIREWLTKYGKLDAIQEKGRKIKATQRLKLLGPGCPQDKEVDSGVDDAVDKGVDVHKDKRVSVSILSPSSVALTKQEPISEKELVGREAIAARLIDVANYQPGEFGEAEQPVLDLLAGTARAPAALIALRKMRDGYEHEQQRPLAVIALAASDFVLARHDDRFAPEVFRTFLDTATKRLQKSGSRRRDAAEQQHVDQEAIDKERARREQAATEELLRSFERTHEEEFVALTARAEASVPVKIQGAFRAPVVQSTLVKLIREHEKGRGGQYGTR